MSDTPLLEVSDLKKYYPIRSGFLRREVGAIKAVDGVSFVLNKGETVGLVGESGCGKTTLGRTVLQLYRATAGNVWLTLPSGERINLATVGSRELRKLRRHMQMIFQDPMSSLDPRMTVLDIITEPMVIAGETNGPTLERRAKELMEAVGLEVKHLNRYPHAFSGGQRQRIGIARALATSPSLIVADEAVSALDVSVQAQILNLLVKLQRQLDLSILFISHDLGVIKHVTDSVVVMYLGRQVERAPTELLFSDPLHPYTAALIASVPEPDPRKRNTAIPLKGEVPNPVNPPPGCYFNPRCPFARDICRSEAPALREIKPGQFAACHFAGQIDARQIGDASSAGFDRVPA